MKKMPKDFDKDDTGRPQAWLREGIIDVAYIHQDQYNVKQLVALAEWCVNAAEYLKWAQQQSDKSTAGAKTR